MPAATIITINVPLVAPLGIPVDSDAVKEVWDAFIKPGQDRGDPQSAEERILMAILRSVYAGLLKSEQAEQSEQDATQGPRDEDLI